MFNSKQKGFLLTEILVVAAIATVIFLIVFNFGNSIFSFNSRTSKNLSAQSDARKVLKTIVSELRSASPSSNGAYPIFSADAYSIIFFVDLDNDAVKERVRYYVQGKEFKKGVVKPSGSPLVYNLANEKTEVLIRDLNNNVGIPIFEYFNSSYTGSGAPLPFPIQINQIRLIRVTFKINSDPNKLPGDIVVTSQVFLRNLKDNL